jgi:Flp pilus assembly protein CpaB
VPRFRRPRSPVHLLRQVTAAALACLALVLALRPPPSAARSPDQQATTPVVVAADDVAAGAVLTGTDLRTTRLPADLVPAGTAAEPGELTGRTLAAPVRRGEPITDVRVVGPGLWSSVPPGQVAAPVRLADLAVATLLRPGDRVDVLAAAGGDGGGGGSVEVVATAALVLTAPPGPGGDDVGPDDTTGGSGLLVLAVPPDTAGRLAAAAAAGTLTVTLGRR